MCLLSRDSIKSALPLKIFLTNQSGWGPSAGSLLPGRDTHQAQRQDHLGGTISFFFFFLHNKRQKVTSVRNLQQMLELEWVGMPMLGWGWIKTLPFSQVGSQAHSDSLPRRKISCPLDKIVCHDPKKPSSIRDGGLDPWYLKASAFSIHGPPQDSCVRAQRRWFLPPFQVSFFLKLFDWNSLPGRFYHFLKYEASK